MTERSGVPLQRRPLQRPIGALLACTVLACSATAAAVGAGPDPAGSVAPSRRLQGSTDAAPSDDAHVSCSEEDLELVVKVSAQALSDKFARAMDDLAMMVQSIQTESNRTARQDLVLRADMCCCNSADWQQLGRSSPWAGYNDCRADRITDLWYGNLSMQDVYGVFKNNRTIATDLAFLSAANTVFPWVVDRQKLAFDGDGFYVTAWIVTSGGVWSSYPGFNQVWPGHYFGDRVGGDWDSVKYADSRGITPQSNSDGVQVWTQPYVAPGGKQVISATSPLYFTGDYQGGHYQDGYVGMVGIDILLGSLDERLAALKPTPQALVMVIDDNGRLIYAPARTVEAIFGPNLTLPSMSCPNMGDNSSRNVSTCSVLTSLPADWNVLLNGILAEPRGQRATLTDIPVQLHGDIVQHTAAFYRWSAYRVPSWTSLVLVPTTELHRAAEYSLPRSLVVSVGDPQTSVEVSFLLQNTGFLNLTYQLSNLPSWITVDSPGPGLDGLSGPSRLVAGSTVQYTLRLNGVAVANDVTQTVSLVWDIADDGYTDCFVAYRALTEISIQISGSSLLVALISSGVPLLATSIVIACICCLCKRRKQLIQLECQAAKKAKEQLNVADTVLSSMAFPIHLLPLPAFLEIQRLTMHEELRDKRLLLVVDVMEELALVEYFFLSHQWTAWNEPDHTGSKYNLMCRAMQSLVMKLQWSSEGAHVWVDYCCIPQRHCKMQALAILSLPVYAARAAAFIIVAPEVRHKETGEVCDLNSYATRAWCRAEQLSYLVHSRHLECMYCTTPDDVCRADAPLVETAFDVFNGSLTCCRLKHKNMSHCDLEHLVLPMLGVYASMLSGTVADREAAANRAPQVLHFFQTAHEKFPRTFNFETEAGAEKRELFGDLPQRMRVHMEAANKVRALEAASASQDFHGASDVCTGAPEHLEAGACEEGSPTHSETSTAAYTGTVVGI